MLADDCHLVERQGRGKRGAMHNFSYTKTGVIFEYQAEFGGNAWVREDLASKQGVLMSGVFHFEQTDLLKPAPKTNAKIGEFIYRFRFGAKEGEYTRIPGRVLGIDNDVLIGSNLELKRSLFAAERKISIFNRLAGLLEHTNPIVVGGDRADAIPLAVFTELLELFPNSYEMDRYADARVSSILSQYVEGMADARGRYEAYLNRKLAKASSPSINLDFLKRFEIEKYILIKNVVRDALENKTDLSEDQWQQLMISFLLLLFPKYIKVLQKVAVNDYYSSEGRKIRRYIDIALVDANGNLDIIEVKKPFEEKILRKSQYRGNNIPTSELSGSIMQAEKYLFHLSKWGVAGEKNLPRGIAHNFLQACESGFPIQRRS